MIWLLVASAKAALVLATSWVVSAVVPRTTPAARHQVWALGVAGALLLPLLSWSLPALPLPLPDLGMADVAPAVVLVTDRISPMPWPAWLAVVWGVGSVLVAIRVLRGHLAAHRLSRSSRPWPAEGPGGAALADAARALGVSGRVDLRRNDTIGSPMTIGVVRPRILLPAEADGWSTERLRAVLIHELGHVGRNDAGIQLGAQLACVVYWWNPLAWLAARRLRIEREHACDDLVIAAGTRPSSYAADLLVVARAVSSRPSHTGAICAVDPSGTEARLRRILDPGSSRRPSAPSRHALRVVAGALVVTVARSSALAVAPPPFVPAPVCGPPSSDAPRATEPAVELGASFVGDVDRCFPDGSSGALVVHWTVDFWGRPADTCVTRDTVGDPAVAACVNAVFEGAEFPELRGRSVEVSFPIER